MIIMWPAAAPPSRPPAATTDTSRHRPHNTAGHTTGITSTSTWLRSWRTSPRRTRPGCGLTGCPLMRRTLIPTTAGTARTGWTWPKWCGSTGSGTGPGKATSRSRTSWAGRISRSAPMSRSAATKPWSTARSASAGPPGSLITRRSTAIRHRRQDPAAERGAARRTVLAAGAARGARQALPLDRAAALVASMVHGAPAPAAASPDELGRGRLRPAPLHPELTNYR